MSSAAATGRAIAPPRTLAALAVGVTLAHLWLAGEVMPDRLGDGAADARPKRIEVVFVRELAPAAPPTAPAPAPVRRARTAAKAPAPAASAVAVAEPPAAASAEPAAAASAAPADQLAQAAPEPAPAGAAAETLPPVPETSTPPSAASAPTAAADAASAPDAVGPEWPPSTRLSYRLSGYYRGPVEGQAQVEWLRSGARYQVHVDLSIGPAFAPLMSRRASSEGDITPEGLRPRRYDEETRVALRSPRRLVIFMDQDIVRLPDGTEQPRPPGVQDSASQFVQLTWLFTMKPALLQPGVVIDIPLALPRRIRTWTYDVLGAEMLATPAGEVAALHVKPRLPPQRGGDMTAEMWVAPSLQYLPVRILIRQDTDSYVDLTVERLPEQAAPGR